VGDHPELLWVERGTADTRVRIGQIRALQHALRLRGDTDRRRAAVIADAEWLNAEAQNALLRLLEEPPPRTTLVLVAATATGLLATVRSRCQRVAFRPQAPDLLADPAARDVVERLEGLDSAPLPDLLDWAEEYRGARAVAAARLQTLLTVGSEWLRQRVASEIEHGNSEVRDLLEAFRALGECRKDLAQRNANPQMVAERALFAVRSALST
jgi:DNA polymerase III delta prime subunit